MNPKHPPAGLARKLLSRLFGDQGERAAARYLKSIGYKIVARGYRTTLGEIDLVAIDGDVVVFVEVKTRKEGLPAEAVTPVKQLRLTNAAIHYLKKHRLLEQRSRFDVIAILWPEGASEPVLTHYRNAFEAVGRGQLFR